MDDFERKNVKSLTGFGAHSVEMDLQYFNFLQTFLTMVGEKHTCIEIIHLEFNGWHVSNRTVDPVLMDCLKKLFRQCVHLKWVVMVIRGDAFMTEEDIAFWENEVSQWFVEVNGKKLDAVSITWHMSALPLSEGSEEETESEASDYRPDPEC